MGFVKETTYKIVDLLSLGKGIKRNISGFTLRLPTRYFRYFPPDYELENFAFLKENCHDGDVVIDIGAHIGLFAVCAAQLAGATGKVYAFEPAAKTNILLKKTISINHQNAVVEPRNEAVAEKEGSTFFFISDTEADNSNSLVKYRVDKKLNKIEVSLVSIDSFVVTNHITTVDFIKIDAEGYEYNVLRGAENTLRRFHPRCILSLHPKGILSNGDSLESIYDLIQRHNYRAVLHGKDLSQQEFCLRLDLFDVHLIPR